MPVLWQTYEPINKILFFVCTPCKHDIMSTITAYECPSLKYRMHCCSTSGRSVWSAPFKNSKDRPHEKQNLVNWLICLPQNGQNVIRGMFICFLKCTFVLGLVKVFRVMIFFFLKCNFFTGLVKVFRVMLICFLKC